MSAYIYLEGGASGPDSKTLDIQCQQAFHKLLHKMGFVRRQPRLVACGGRSAVYDRFVTRHSTGGATLVALWIDSEEPLSNLDATWAHLKSRDGWEQPAGADDEQVLFMTTCMETWIVADRAALRLHYGHNLNENALPPLNGLEGRDRHDVQDRLERATKDCKNAFAKGKRSFDVLEELDPAALKQHLPSFVRVARILRTKL